jgi:hypothetical protein
MKILKKSKKIYSEFLIMIILILNILYKVNIKITYKENQFPNIKRIYYNKINSK